jgi:Zn finger protein HypA/HybF involved in hydrogenase expression
MSETDEDGTTHICSACDNRIVSEEPVMNCPECGVGELVVADGESIAEEGYVDEERADDG